MPLHLEIVTAERVVYRDDVDMVIAPAWDGAVGILPHHAPLLTTLQIGELIARSQLRALADGDLTDAARLNPQPHPRRRHALAGARVDQLIS